MEGVAIIVALVGLIAFLAYKRGKVDANKEELERQVQSGKQRDAIRNMSDTELDDRLSDYWD